MKPDALARAVLLACALALASCADADVRVLYLLHCGGCHREDGGGAPPIVPDLRNDLGRLVTATGGRAYLARVPGAAQAPISDAELTAVLNYILHEFNAATLPQAFKDLGVAEVSRARAHTLADPLKARAALWRLVAPEPYP